MALRSLDRKSPIPQPRVPHPNQRPPAGRPERYSDSSKL